ncbi:MAG: hypothetical protein MR473_06325 [Clostridiales bacterium]|nr:hypothetical protein [Clostridiales bacterium]
MKRYLKKYGLITLFVCLVLVITGLAILENRSEVVVPSFGFGEHRGSYRDNTDLAYTRWTYRNHIGDWYDHSNLTDTAKVENICAGAEFLIDSWEAYQQYMAIVEQKDASAKKAAAAAEFYEIDGIISEEMKTYDGEIDEEFFRENKLAVLDFCFEGCSYLRSRLKEVRTDDGVVEISLEVQLSIAATTEQTGQIYWIPVSASCTSVESTFQRVHWNRS